MSRGDRYILVDRKPQVCEDLLRWARWMGEDNRRVAQSTVGPLTVSTVFLGIDHSFGDGDEAILFETMIFNDTFEELYCDRYASWSRAEFGHTEAVREAERIVQQAKELLK